MTSSANLTREEAITQVVRELEGPTPIEVIVDRVLQRKPSRAKDARSPIRGDLRLWAYSFGVVFADLERKIVMPVEVAMRGVRFRHLMTDQEISNRTLWWDESDHIYLASKYKPADFTRRDLELIDVDGRTIAEEMRSAPMRVDTGAGFVTIQAPGRKLTTFLRQHQVRAGDSLLFTIEQFDPPRWRMEHEPQAQRNQAAIEQRNRELMDILYQMLEASPQEYIGKEVAVRSALFQMADPTGYPGDPWLEALRKDGRMKADMIGIVYADSTRWNPFDFLEPLRFDDDDSFDELEESAELPPLPEGAAERIYTFKVSSVSRKSLWRRIEVLGAETLAELNISLVELFKHDNDHLGGFWKVVPRGNSKRVREVELATVDPLGWGEGSDLRVAELDLAIGGILKWVYDFGDWNEYKMQLEAVAEPASPPDADTYPRVVAANKPQLLYCTTCRAQGKLTVAAWCCWNCSNEQNETVMLCEECSRRDEHEEHYLEEWAY